MPDIGEKIIGETSFEEQTDLILQPIKYIIE